MGLSSSQARLLHLTSRMHQIEHKAAKVQAEKLQMANESARVREDYLNALEETRIQYSRLTSDGSVEFRNANANILQNGVIPTYEGEHSLDSLFLQRANGRIVITPDVAENFHIDPSDETTLTLDEYLATVPGIHQSPIYEYTTEDIPNSIASFSPIHHGTVTPYQDLYSYDYSGAVVNRTTPAPGTIPGEDFQANTTYTIGNEAELALFLQKVNGRTDLNNVRIELTSDINMNNPALAGYTPANCAGVTFDGNGHKITGLTKPLFGLISNSNIENIQIGGNPVFGPTTSSTLGALAITMSGTSSIKNVTVEFETGGVSNDYSLEIEGTSYVGGLVGRVYDDFTIENCCLNKIRIGGTLESGGLIGTVGQSGHSANVTIDNCEVSADVTGPYKGLLVGCIENGNVTITNSTWNISGEGTTYANTAVGGTSQETYNPGNPQNTGAYNTNNELTGSIITTINDLADEEVTFTDATIPTLNATTGEGAYYSNVMAVLAKAGAYDMHTSTPSEMPNNVKTYLRSFQNNNDGNAELFYLNNYIVNYLNGSLSGSQATNFVNALLADINNGSSTSGTSNYRTGNIEHLRNVTRSEGSEWTPYHNNSHDGSVTIPALSDIKEGVLYAFQKAGFYTDDTESQINNFFNLYHPEDSNPNYKSERAFLSYINDLICTYAAGGSSSNLQELRTCIENNQRLENYPSYLPQADISHYTIEMAAPQHVPHTPQTHVVQSEDPIGWFWDPNDPDVAQAMAMYYLSQRGVDILTDDEAESFEYLTNLISSGEAVLTTFNPSNVQALTNIPEDELANMTDSQYNELLGIVNTSVAVEPGLQEVQYTEELRQAEARYEAGMRKIDKKERKYDKDLASLDNERNAIKQEMDTLKTVAKDNVERTFKLFS